MTVRIRSHRSLLLAGLAAWLAVSLPTWIDAQASPRFPLWAIAWAVCGAAMVAASLRPRLDAVAAAALAVQGAAVATMATCCG